MDRERLRWWREELEDSVYQPLGEEECKEIAALLKHAEAQERRIEELEEELDLARFQARVWGRQLSQLEHHLEEHINRTRAISRVHQVKRFVKALGRA